jgi:molybdenum cofactor cytidylyltransferase
MQPASSLSVSDITGVLLAAGSSQRFGGNKLLAEIGGLPLILHAAAALLPCDRLLAVIRKDDAELASLLADNAIETVINHHADHGLGSSIACAIATSRNGAGWCLLPADMPFVKPATTGKVLDTLMQGPAIAAPFYHGQRGHPVGFSMEMAEDLLALDEDMGARHIIADNQHRLVKIETQDEGILVDIDTPEDLLLQAMQSNLVS